MHHAEANPQFILLYMNHTSGVLSLKETDIKKFQNVLCTTKRSQIYFAGVSSCLLYENVQLECISDEWPNIRHIDKALKEGQQPHKLVIRAIIIPTLDGNAILQLKTKSLHNENGNSATS